MFILIGALGLAISVAAFLSCLPKNGRTMPLVGTVWEPYVAIFVTMGSILSFGAMAMGIVDIVF